MIAWRIEQFDKLPSTMDTLRERALSDYSEGVVIVAAEQTKGRGRGNNIWQAPLGNLSCSLLVRPQLHQNHAGQYSFVTACALQKTFAEFINPPHKAQNKWPNDILLNGIKAAGILLESDVENNGMISYLNIGVGVNIVYAPVDKIALNHVIASPVNATDFLSVFLNHLNKFISQYRMEGFKPIKDEWLKNAHALGEMIIVRLSHETINGVFKGLNDDGALILELETNKIRLIHSGDVYFAGKGEGA